MVGSFDIARRGSMCTESDHIDLQDAETFFVLI
jgi:hypothetical protein